MTAVRPGRREAHQGPGEAPPREGARADDTVRLRTLPEPPGGAPAGPDDTVQLRLPAAAPTGPHRAGAPRAGAPRADASQPGAPRTGPLPEGGPDDTLQLRLPPVPPSPGPAAAPPTGGRAERRRAARAQSRGRGGRAAAPQGGGPAAGRAGRRPGAARGREPLGVKVVRAVGELCVTLGVLLLLFVSYQLWWTNVRAHEAADGAADSLEKQWAAGPPGGSRDPDDPRDPGAFAPGQGFAILWIPKLDVKAPIAEGTDKHAVLDKGMVGHYTGVLKSAMPWAKAGNFALAAHRNTHGEPFRYINRLAVGDKVVVETARTYYVYAITSALPQTPPSNVSVIQPVPVGSGFTRPGRYITLTTCTPEFTSTYRLIVWGKMVEERPRSKGKPDALVGS
ncbi:class E sortase [Streptomyces sp. NPDC001380]|uniref:class E sortase n=1 Tax=Streptomyces sp. NPDC001380 TaxID=3364566 RepID=UPI00368F2D1A